MLKRGILNPSILSLLARVRHTNTLVIADRGFPYWPEIETVDISLAAAERLIKARLDSEGDRRLVREYIGSLEA